MSCPDCFSGHVSSENPTGHETKVHGLPCYLAEPAAGHTPKGIIVFIPDAFGWRFVNSRILADHYAARGDFRVFLPDFMHDGMIAKASIDVDIDRPAPVWLLDVMPKVLNTSSIEAWLLKPYYIFLALRGFIPFAIMNRFSVSLPKVEAFVSALRTNEAATLPLGAAGFCWGGKHALHLATASSVLPNTRKSLVDAVFTGHPSGVAIPSDLTNICQPVSVAIGDKDFAMNVSTVREMERALTALDVRTEVVVYEGAKHGFCVRPDPKSAKESEQKVQAEDQAMSWFTRMFSLVSAPAAPSG